MNKKPSGKVYYSQFIDSIKSYAKVRLFFVYGNDDYLKDRIIALLLEQFTKPGTEDFDAITLYGDNCRGSEILEQLEILPFMASFKFVLLKNFDDLKKNDKNLLEKYCQNPVDSSVLLIVAEKADNRTTFLKLLTKEGIVVECKKPYNSTSLLNWLDIELRSRNLIMDMKSRNFLVNNIELSYQAAENELEKLFLFTRGEKNYTIDDVEATLGAFRENTIYDLQRALGNKDMKLSQVVLNNMIEAEEASNIGVMIVAMLSRYFLILWKILAYRHRNYSDPEIAQNHLSDVFYSFRDEYIKASYKYDIYQLKQIFSLLLQADTDLKSIDIDDTTLFLLIYNICRQ